MQGWGGSGMGHVGVGWVMIELVMPGCAMQGWGGWYGSCRGGVGHVGMGWGVSCRVGVGHAVGWGGVSHAVGGVGHVWV